MVVHTYNLSYAETQARGSPTKASPGQKKNKKEHKILSEK
jgi:hypothetical protein